MEAAVSLGINNSRMKDLYDLCWLQSHLSFKGRVLTEAVTNTFARRATPIPEGTPIAFTEEFYTDEQKLLQWNAFVRKGKLTPLPLNELINDLSQFLLPLIRMEVVNHQWTPLENWQPLGQSA